MKGTDDEMSMRKEGEAIITRIVGLLIERYNLYFSVLEFWGANRHTPFDICTGPPHTGFRLD